MLNDEQLELIKNRMELGDPIKIGAKKHNIQITDVKKVKQQLFDKYSEKVIKEILRKYVMPSVKQMTKSFLKDSKTAVIKSIKDKQIMTNNDEYERKLSICNGCDFFDGDNCASCGCVMAVKAKFHGFKCPKGKF